MKNDLRHWILIVESVDLMESIEGDLSDIDLPEDVKATALRLYRKVAHNTLLCGDSTVVNGYWIETHTLGCRNAGDDPEDEWQQEHEVFYEKYSNDGVSIVVGDPYDGGIFITITPQKPSKRARREKR